MKEEEEDEAEVMTQLEFYCNFSYSYYCLEEKLGDFAGCPIVKSF